MGLLDGKTLASVAEVDAVQGRITPPLALGDNPAGLQIRLDDELLTVAGGKRDVLLFQSKVKVEHPAGTAVLLASEAAVSASAEASLDPFAAAGAEQVIRLLGPYAVEFDDPAIAAGGYPGVELVDLDPGVIVINAWFLPSAEWLAGGGTQLHSFQIDVEQDGTDFYAAIYDAIGAGANGPDAEPFDLTGTITKRIIRTIAGAKLRFEVYGADDSDNTFTQGQAQVYALIAEPA